MFLTVVNPVLNFGTTENKMINLEKRLHNQIIDELLVLEQVSKNLQENDRKTIGTLVARLLNQIPAFDNKTNLPSREFKF